MQFVMCGSCTMEEELSPYTVTKAESCQRILKLINGERYRLPEIASRLGVSEETVLDDLRALEKAGLVESSARGYSPAFAIFTRDDQKRLQPLIGRISRAYEHAVEQSMDVVRAAYDDCGFADRGFSFADMAYILVGAYILDYGGLDFLLRSGFLAPARQRPGGRYVFVGYEGKLFNLRGSWMFGHNYRFGPFIFSGHGELPAEGGRKAFPEQAYRWWAEGRPEAEVKQVMEELGHILVALYQGTRTLQALSQSTGLSVNGAEEHLQLLQELSYVRKNGAWSSRCPVVVPEARARIGGMVEEGIQPSASRVLRGGPPPADGGEEAFLSPVTLGRGTIRDLGGTKRLPGPGWFVGHIGTVQPRLAFSRLGKAQSRADYLRRM